VFFVGIEHSFVSPLCCGGGSEGKMTSIIYQPQSFSNKSLLPSMYDSEEEEEALVIVAVPLVKFEQNAEENAKVASEEILTGSQTNVLVNEIKSKPISSDEVMIIEEDETMRAESSDESKDVEDDSDAPDLNKMVSSSTLPIVLSDKARWTEKELRLLTIAEKHFKFDYERIRACVGFQRSRLACERKLHRLVNEPHYSCKLNLTNEEVQLVENVRTMSAIDLKGLRDKIQPELDQSQEKTSITKQTSSKTESYSSEIPRLNAKNFSPKTLEENVRKMPICFIEGLLVNMNQNVFTMAELSFKFGDSIIDVLQQDPDSLGFRIAPHKKSSEPLADYIRYAQDLEKEIATKQEIALEEIHSRVLMKMSIPNSQRCDDTDTIGQFMGTLKGKGSFVENAENFRSSLSQGRSMSHNANGPASHHLELPVMTRTETSTAHEIAQEGGDDESGAKPNIVKFAVNIDSGNWTEITNELEKLPNWCKWGKYDPVLGHLPDSMVIPGMSLPQLYCKVPGVWTGGHEENVRFHSINNNHGPGCSIWGAIAPEYVSKLREIVLAKHHVDIYKSEGRWFPDPEFCRENDIPMMIGIQKPGDTVILNGATLHWVRSAGFAVNSSWNFGVRDAKQMQLAIERDAINVELGIRNIVPLRSLAIQLLIDFRNTHSKDDDLPLKDLNEVAYLKSLIGYLLPQGDIEADYRTMFENGVKSGKKKSGKRRNLIEYLLEPKESLVLLCDFCWKEIVHTYMVCDTCAHKNEANGLTEDFAKALPVFFCPECGLEHGKRKPNHELEARYKYVEKQEDDFCDWIYNYDEYFNKKVVCEKSLEEPSCSSNKKIKRRKV
jgi:hypothetical protein